MLTSNSHSVCYTAATEYVEKQSTKEFKDLFALRSHTYFRLKSVINGKRGNARITVKLRFNLLLFFAPFFFRQEQCTYIVRVACGMLVV